MLDAIVFGSDRVDVSLSGVITAQEILDGTRQILAHPNHAAFQAQLWRLHSVESLDVDADDLHRFIETVLAGPPRHPDLKLAIVTDSQLAFGLARMYEAYADRTPWKTQVFYEVDDAERWLET